MNSGDPKRWRERSRLLQLRRHPERFPGLWPGDPRDPGEVVYLVPRGSPSPYTCWKDPDPHPVRLTRPATPAGWYGRPLANPTCPELFYPRFAWAEANPGETGRNSPKGLTSGGESRT